MNRFSEITDLFCITSPIGYTQEAVNNAKAQMGEMPAVLEQFYLTYGLSRELQGLQDALILPNKYPIFLECGYLVFFNENQGVCQAGVHKKDLLLPDPPVYVGYDNNNEWMKSSETVSDFLVAMYGYQASICLEHNTEEFYWISPEEQKQIDSIFSKRKEAIKDWINCSITLYSADNHARIALMDTGSDIQMNYAANNKRSLELIIASLEGIGEPI